MLLHEIGSPPPRAVCLWELDSLRGGGAPASWRGFGRCGFHLYRGFQVPLFFLPSSSSCSPPPLRNSLPSPSIALSSLLLHGRPKVLVLDSRWSGFADPLPTQPIPSAPALGKGSRIHSSLLASTQHDLGDEVDNGRRRLVGVKLCEEVASVVCGAALLPGHEAEELSRGTSLCLHPLPFLWIQVTEGDSVEGVVSSKEELSLIVSQCDSLGRDLEVNNGGSWRGVSSQSLRCGFGNGLWPSE